MQTFHGNMSYLHNIIVTIQKYGEMNFLPPFLYSLAVLLGEVSKAAAMMRIGRFHQIHGDTNTVTKIFLAEYL